jgi:hypothetical protein
MGNVCSPFKFMHSRIRRSLMLLVIKHLVVTEKGMWFDKDMDIIKKKRYYVTFILTVHLLKKT